VATPAALAAATVAGAAGSGLPVLLHARTIA